MAHSAVQIIKLKGSGRDFQRRAYDAIRTLGWEIRRTGEDYILAYPPVYIYSIPKKVEVELLLDGEVEVKCSNKRWEQIIDWGTNKRLLTLLLEEIEQTP